MILISSLRANFPDNPCILKERVKELTANYDGIPSINDLRQVMTEVKLSLILCFLCNLLKSYSTRMQAVVQACGGHMLILKDPVHLTFINKYNVSI